MTGRITLHLSAAAAARNTGRRDCRRRVAISSSNSPRFEANQNSGKLWPHEQNYPAVVAHQTIFLGGADGSSIMLPQVVEAAEQ